MKPIRCKFCGGIPEWERSHNDIDLYFGCLKCQEVVVREFNHKHTILAWNFQNYNIKDCKDCGSSTIHLAKKNYQLYCFSCGKHGEAAPQLKNAVKKWNKIN